MKVIRDYFFVILILYVVPLLICKLTFNLNLFEGDHATFKTLSVLPLFNVAVSLICIFILLVNFTHKYLQFMINWVF
jgi:hypothetical protein